MGAGTYLVGRLVGANYRRSYKFFFFFPPNWWKSQLGAFKPVTDMSFLQWIWSKHLSAEVSLYNHTNANAMLDSVLANISFKSSRSYLVGGYIFVKQLLMLSFTLKPLLK